MLHLDFDSYLLEPLGQKINDAISHIKQAIYFNQFSNECEVFGDDDGRWYYDFCVLEHSREFQRAIEEAKTDWEEIEKSYENL